MNILLYCNLVLLLALYCRFIPGNKLKYPVAFFIVFGGLLSLSVQFHLLSVSLGFLDNVYFLCSGLMIIFLLQKTFTAPPGKSSG